MRKLNRKETSKHSIVTQFSNTIRIEQEKKHKTSITNSSLEKAIVTFDKMLDKGIIQKRESNTLSLTQSLEKSILFNL